jgi:alkylation response protein AidB-like acyl-CoA dehydrogenase
MDFSFSAEQQEYRDAVFAFAKRVLGGDVSKRDAAGEFSRELWRECAEFGIQGLPFPSEFGGSGADVLTTMIAMEALGYACRDQGLLFSIHAHMWSVAMPLLTFGTDEQKQRYLSRLCDGSWIGAHGMSEPNSGSDAYALRTRAEPSGTGFVLNGTKMFVTNAPHADLFMVFATTNARRKMWGVTGFLIERGTKGLSVSPPIAKLGLTTSPMAEVILEDCEIPAENLLGRPGQGATIFSHSMGWERSCILASTVGRLQRQLESSLSYVKTRHQFEQPIGNFQLVASRIVDMKMRLETSRLLLYRAAWLQSRGELNALEAAMAKLYISEAAVQSALDAIQVHGGYGYMKEYEVERDLRDAIGSRLYSGTSEIQRMIMARGMGLSPG